MIAGVPGFAAWVGIEVLADPKPGSNVFISAASGAVGMYAGQLAKLRGCRVIGSTGSDEKVLLILLILVSLATTENFLVDVGYNLRFECFKSLKKIITLLLLKINNNFFICL